MLAAGSLLLRVLLAWLPCQVPQAELQRLHLSCVSCCVSPLLLAMLPLNRCGNEIKSVVNAVSRFDRWPMGKIDQTHMWQVRGGG